MKISRRSFFKKTSLTAFSAGVLLQFNPFARAQDVSGKDGFPIPAASQSDLLGQLDRASFESYLNSQFYFQPTQGDAGGAILQLTKTADTRPEAIKKSEKHSGECFSLTFRGSIKESLEQDTYFVQHSVLGNFMLLITVVGRTRREVIYEAVINRLQPQF